jgi:hypothetical protein
MELHAFALLCGIATVTCCAHIASVALDGWRWLVMVLLSLFILSPLAGLLPSVAPLSVQPSHAALLIALAAMSLLRRRSAKMALTWGGLVTAMWISALLTAGYPMVIAFTWPLAGAAITQALSLRCSGFRSEALLQEALVVLLVIALTVALVPELLAGWRSASALQGIDAAPVSAPVAGLGAISVATVCVVLGILYTGWKYK